MDVRRARKDDLVTVGRIAFDAVWRAYDDILPAGTITDALDRLFAPSALKRRMLAGTLLVAVDATGVVAGFVAFDVDLDHIHISALSTVPTRSGVRAEPKLLEAVCAKAPDLPVSTDIVLGNLDREGFHEQWGFSPGETVPSDAFGPAVVQRRWWLPPRR